MIALGDEWEGGMSTHLPDAVKKGLEDARVAMLRKSGRLCVHADDRVFRVVKLWDDGFSVMAEDAPHLRGLVDLYDGPEHLMQCLIVASEEAHGLMSYEYKRATQVSDHPPVDFERGRPAPKGLIERLL